MSNSIFNADKMYTYIRGFATALEMQQTLRALAFAREKHKGQIRKSGDPYIIHPLTMACNALSLGIKDDNVIATILPAKISDIVSNSSVVVVDYAVTPHSRVSPSYFKSAAIGLLLGIVFASAIVIVRDLTDDVIHDEDYLVQNFKQPVLATIPDLTARTSRKYGYYGSSSRASRKGGVD